MDHNSSPGVELETEVDQLIFDWSELDDQSNTAYTNSGMRTLHSNESNPSSGPAGLTTFASTGSNSCSETATPAGAASSALMKKLHSRSSTSSSMGGWEDEGNLSGSASSYTPSSAIAAAAVMKRMHASCSRTSTGSDLWADVHEEYGTSVLMRKLGSDSSTGSVPVPGIGSGLGLGSTGQMGTATGKQISPGAMLLQNNGHSGGSSTAASSRCGSALGMSAHGHGTGVPSGPHRSGAHTHNSSMRSIITDISEDMAVMSVSGINSSSSRDVDDRDTEGFGDIILSKSGSRPASPFADLGIGPGGSSSGGGSNSNSNSSRSRTTLGLISKQIQINNDYDPDHCQDSEYDGYVSPRLTKSALSQASSSFTPKANAGYKSESCFNFNIPRTSLNREHSLSLLPHPVPGISGGSVGVGLRSAGVDDQLVALSDGEGLLTSGPICGITDNIFVDGFEQVYDPNPDDSDHSNDLGGGNGEEQDAEDDDDEDDEGLPDSTSAIGSNNSSRASTCNSVSGLARENVFYFKTGGVAPLVLSPTAAASRNGRNRDNSFESAGTLVADQNDDRNSTLGLNLGGLHPGHSLGITIPLELMAAPTDAPGSAISHNSASDKRGNSLFRMKNVEPGVKTAPVSRRKRRKLITIPDVSVSCFFI